MTLVRTRRVVGEAENKRFCKWLAQMDEAIAWFVAAVRQQGFTLDFSFASLDDLEKAIEQKIGTADWETWSNEAARYVGEVFRRNAGGRWELYQANPKDGFYGLPVITDFADTDYDLCPIELVQNFGYGRRSGLLRSALENDAKVARHTR